MENGKGWETGKKKGLYTNKNKTKKQMNKIELGRWIRMIFHWFAKTNPIKN